MRRPWHQLLGRRWRWLRPLARRVSDAFKSRARPRQIEVVRFLLSDKGFLRATEKYELRLVDRFAGPPAMSPVAAAAVGRAGDPQSRRTGRLAWNRGRRTGLVCRPARPSNTNETQGRLRHYHYRTMSKRFGQVRLIEAPKERLKDIQRRILAAILDRIPPHASVHGFRRGRSVKTFASLHTGKQVVLRLDLQDFFPSISAARIQALFRTAGYPERVADLLAGLCTNSAPWTSGTHCNPSDRPCKSAGPLVVFQAPSSAGGANVARAGESSCLPDGLPTVGPGKFCRRRSTRAMRTTWRSRATATSIALSGDFNCTYAAIVMEEGFAVHHRKTRIMRQGVRQRLAGVVVNEHVNVIRADYDRLKATLTNCIRHGAQSQNRTNCEDFRAHLLGRIAFVDMLNPHRGARLRALFERIEW